MMKSIPAIVLGCFVTFGVSFCSAEPTFDAPVYTNNTRFRIPFRYDATEIQSLGAKEIQLYVSSDKGLQWQLAGRVVPGQGKFEFQAPGDGEFWFSVRTLDAQNRLHPSGQFQPGLKVSVDTTKPTLRLLLRQTNAAQVDLSWNVDDRNLDPSTLRLEYLQTGSQEWREVSIVPQAAGSTSWGVPEGGFVAVRGSVSDLASNVVTSESQVRIVPGGPQNRGPSVPDLSQPIAGNNRPAAVGPLVPDPFAFTSNRSGHSAVPAFPATNSQPIISPRSRAGYAAFPTTPATSYADQSVPGFSTSQQPPPPTPQRNNRERIVNTLNFQIGYEVEQVGPSGVQSVDLFITQDGGKKWYRYGNDPDRISPFRVNVPRDGVYGFTLRVRSGVGLGDAPPQPNDKPSMVIVVDKTPPAIEMLPAQQGRGTELNKILIRWKMNDQHPADAPIALYYSRSPKGPWEPIGGWHENTGSYAWTVGNRVPPKFYVRLVARDVAGNLSQVDSDYPVIVDLTRPSARIVDVESIDQR